MSDRKIQRALISVYDKTGVVDFARALHVEFGIEILSTGGTAALLKENGIPVTLVEEITGFPEMLDGRVKTLHPKIHAAILADRDNPDHMKQLADAGIEPIDMVVVNLYPFEKTIARPGCTFDEVIEMIDIGGPCLLRAAAKNHEHVLVGGAPELYSPVLDSLRNWSDDRVRSQALQSGASGAFWRTTMYDRAVATWLSFQCKQGPPDDPRFQMWSWGGLRYGENPHQRAELLRLPEGTDPNRPANADVKQSPEPPSYNNYVDGSAALELCRELTQERGRRIGHLAGPRPVCVFVKHTNPCGVGMAGDPIEAYRRAYLGDPKAAMGGVLACNFTIRREWAQPVMESLDRWGRDAGAGAFFVDVWIATAFDESAIECIRALKPWGRRVHLWSVGDMTRRLPAEAFVGRQIVGAILLQSPDRIGLNEDDWYVPTDRAPTDREMSDLRVAWLICKHTKSNAITLVRDGQLIGNGAGQMSRVMSCRIATWLAEENRHLENDEAGAREGLVAASDAFFPFRDGPDILIDAGVTAIIQPGGSKRDADTIAACNERGVAMVFTGTRHFRH